MDHNYDESRSIEYDADPAIPEEDDPREVFPFEEPEPIEYDAVSDEEFWAA